MKARRPRRTKRNKDESLLKTKKIPIASRNSHSAQFLAKLIQDWKDDVISNKYPGIIVAVDDLTLKIKSTLSKEVTIEIVEERIPGKDMTFYMVIDGVGYSFVVRR